MTDADERKDDRTEQHADGLTDKSQDQRTKEPVERKSERKKEKKERTPSPVPALISRARLLLSRLIWIVCVLAALVLAVAALLIALGANQDNGLVKGVLDLAKVADVNVFSLDSPIKRFSPPDAATKTALLNYGIGALAWLVVGRIVAAVVRPRS